MVHLVRELFDLVVPSECAICHRPGQPVCARCRTELAALARRDGGVMFDALGEVHCWGHFDAVLGRLVTAWKDEGRRDVRTTLAPLLSAAVRRAASSTGASHGDLLLVPVPTSRRALRQRGDWPLRELAALVAEAEPRWHVAPALGLTRAVRDQSRLGRAGREANLGGAMTVHPRWTAVLRRAPVVVLDDVSTTGATLREARAAVRRVTGEAPAAAVISVVPAPSTSYADSLESDRSTA